MNSHGTFSDFVRLGIEHVFLGADHLLFLAGLFLVIRRGRELLVILASFTLTHSLTLGLAALGIVAAPAWITEPLIAASILYVGVEDYLVRDMPTHRWIVTFLFGLAHGFGFASALRLAGIDGSVAARAVPLFGFNLGVEIGQCSIAAVAMPPLWWLMGSAKFKSRWLPWTASIVAVAGLALLVHRLLQGRAT